MIHIFTQLLLVIALMMICVSMTKHHKKVFPVGLDVNVRGKLKLAGWFVVLMSYFGIVRGIGWGEGSVVWVGHVTLAAILVITVISTIKNVRSKY